MILFSVIYPFEPHPPPKCSTQEQQNHQSSMKKITITLISLILSNFAFSQEQEGKLLENRVILFQLEEEEDTIEFVVVDTTLQEKKPLFLWCQGSLPLPLFGEIEDYGFYFFGGGITNLNEEKIKESYHIVVISMPKTPILARKENLNNSYQYIPDKNNPRTFLPAYVKADYLQNYVDRANKVLSYLGQKDWVDPQKLVVAGHSQGSKVATKIATSNSAVTHLGLFSTNPFGRIDQFTRQARLDAQVGKISWEKADSMMNEQYAFFRQTNHTDSIKANPSLKAWKSFSETFYDDWLTLDIPIYLAYGTEDRIADLCDLVPLFFIQANKSNLTLKRYIGLEHNFFEVEEDGQVNQEKGHWKTVMGAFLDWVE